MVSFKTIWIVLPWHFPMKLHWKQYSIFYYSSLIFCCSNVVRWSRVRAQFCFQLKFKYRILPCNRNIKSNAHKLGFMIIFIHFIEFFLVSSSFLVSFIQSVESTFSCVCSALCSVRWLNYNENALPPSNWCTQCRIPIQYSNNFARYMDIKMILDTDKIRLTLG